MGTEAGTEAQTQGGTSKAEEGGAPGRSDKRAEPRSLRLVLPASGTGGSTERLPDPIPSGQMTLVEQLTEWARVHIDERVFRAGMRMPSIRNS